MYDNLVAFTKNHQYKKSFDTGVILLCVMKKDAIKKFSNGHYPYLIPSLVKKEAIGVLCNDYTEAQALKEVNFVLDKLEIKVRGVSDHDIERGRKRFHELRARARKGVKFPGENDCVILACMRRIGITHVAAADEPFIKEARHIGFTVDVF